MIKRALPDRSYVDATIYKMYEDPFTLGLKEMYARVNREQVTKTTPADATQDLEILGMLIETVKGEW